MNIQLDPVLQKRWVRAVLYFFILVAPYIFAWFTLAKQFSRSTRILSFAWMVVAILIIAREPDDPSRMSVAVTQDRAEDQSVTSRQACGAFLLQMKTRAYIEGGKVTKCAELLGTEVFVAATSSPPVQVEFSGSPRTLTLSFEPGSISQATKLEFNEVYDGAISAMGIRTFPTVDEIAKLLEIAGELGSAEECFGVNNARVTTKKQGFSNLAILVNHCLGRRADSGDTSARTDDGDANTATVSPVNSAAGVSLDPVLVCQSFVEIWRQTPHSLKVSSCKTAHRPDARLVKISDPPLQITFYASPPGILIEDGRRGLDQGFRNDLKGYYLVAMTAAKRNSYPTTSQLLALHKRVRLKAPDSIDECFGNDLASANIDPDFEHNISIVFDGCSNSYMNE